MLENQGMIPRSGGDMLCRSVAVGIDDNTASEKSLIFIYRDVPTVNIKHVRLKKRSFGR